MKNKSIVIAGAGFSGSYIGRNLAEKGWDVKIVEIKDHIAGHCYDKVDEETGCLVHEFGPHIFHTNDDDIWNWLNRFSDFTPYNLKTQVFFESYKEFFTCSFGFHTARELFEKEKADKLISNLKKAYPGREKVTIPELLKSEDELVREFVNVLWEEDYKPYTAKQWGMNPKDVDVNILKRVPVYMSDFDKIHNDKYEALPSEGYTRLFEEILDHDNIEVQLSTSALDHLRIEDNKVIYDGEEVIFLFTGAIDELFEYEFGPLRYRSLEFVKEVTPNDKDTKSGDPSVDIYPDAKYGYTRITNYGKLPIQNELEFQISAKEYPSEFKVGGKLGRFYPISTENDKELLSKYNAKAEKVKGLYLSGRLAHYKYYDMDKSLMAARDTLNKILEEFNE